MAAPAKIPHVKFVRAKGKLYPYFDTGEKNAKGNPIRVRLPALSSSDFWDRYAALKAGRTKRSSAKAYTIRELCDDYERSKAFTAKASNTQTLYRLTMRRIAGALGDFPV